MLLLSKRVTLTLLFAGLMAGQVENYRTIFPKWCGQNCIAVPRVKELGPMRAIIKASDANVLAISKWQFPRLRDEAGHKIRPGMRISQTTIFYLRMEDILSSPDMHTAREFLRAEKMARSR